MGRLGWDDALGEFFWPDTLSADPAIPAKNNDSLVLRLSFGERSALLPRDAEKEAERQILAENVVGALQADILKIGHHGGENSTTLEFLEAVQPRVAIISTGEDNAYGHPSPKLLERLQNAGIPILRTDRDGGVQVLTDGRNIEIACFVDCSHVAADVALRQAHAPDHQQNAHHQ